MMVRLTLALLAIVALCSAHSEMLCANYDRTANKCLAPVRNAAQTLIQQSYVFSANPSQICQVPFQSPVSSFYANGKGCPSWAPCPDPMGTIKQGASFNVMWYARNHAVANQSPGNVQVYLSPVITSSTTSDPTVATMKNNKICEGSYSNCPAGNGDTNQCYLQCTMPSNLANGNYTLMWYWDWTSNDGKIYSACADVAVGGGSSASVTTGSTSSTTGTKTTTSTTGTKATTSTTGTKSTTSTSTSTTGTSTSGGCESIILSVTPKTIASNSVFNVTLGYRTQGSRDLVVDLINGNNWYGKGTTSVPSGKGTATVTVTAQGNPPAGSNYQFHAWSVNQGMANVANAWNSAYDNDYKTVTVGNFVQY